jgi:hypothetical protein
MAGDGWWLVCGVLSKFLVVRVRAARRRGDIPSEDKASAL